MTAAAARSDAMLALARAGRDADAAALASALLAADADHALALLVQGVVAAKAARYADALAAFERALAGAPELAALHVNRGHAFDALGRYHEAVLSYRGALARGSDGAHLRLRIASALARCGEIDAALASIDVALALDPQNIEAVYERIDLLVGLGRDADAVAALHAASAAGADPEHVAYALAALGHGPAAAAAPQGYVRQLFDGYADSFDAHLVGHLGYRGPQLVAEALAALAPQPCDADVLDLGCGTGLCGPLLRPRARTLVGVDLSARMLMHARNRGVYDELVEAELCAFASARPAAFDVAVAAEVLNYFGDLAPPLAAVRAALRPGGVFVFSLEAHDGDASAMLHRGRRYAHARRAVDASAADAGYRVLAVQPCTLRQDRDGPVAGWLVTLRA